MRQLVIIALLCLPMGGSLWSQTLSRQLKPADPSLINSENPAVIAFEETIHDFGELRAGDVVTHKFKFTNTGKSPLIIVDAKSSCGCTVPAIPEEPIAPGEGGEIVVKFDSSHKSGDVQKLVRITANTYPETISKITIRAKVLSEE